MDCDICDHCFSKEIGNNPTPKIEWHQGFGSDIGGSHYIKFEKNGVERLAIIKVPEGLITVITQVDQNCDLFLQAKNNVLNLLSHALRLSIKVDREEENFVADKLSDALDSLADQVSMPDVLSRITREGFEETMRLMDNTMAYIRKHDAEMRKIIKDTEDKRQVVDDLLRHLKGAWRSGE